MPIRFFVIGALALVTSGPAYGYIDPGVGSVMVQAILAGSAGIMMIIKLYWRRIANRFGFKSIEEGKDASEP